MGGEKSQEIIYSCTWKGTKSEEKERGGDMSVKKNGGE